MINPVLPQTWAVLGCKTEVVPGQMLNCTYLAQSVARNPTADHEHRRNLDVCLNNTNAQFTHLQNNINFEATITINNKERQ
jgi:hypothetical protein